jgi:glycosyltransferase involved in cell wall biosynthesis
MTPYKRVDLVVEAFRHMPEKRLIVIGDGPEFSKVKRKVGPNVVLMGYQPFEVLRDSMQRARAFVFAAEEDFGIAPVEAQACGTPVIAFGRGGVRETVRGLESEQPTGVFFERQTADDIVAAVKAFEAGEREIISVSCRMNALRFGVPRFREEFTRFVTAKWESFQNNRFSLG